MISFTMVKKTRHVV